MATKREQRALRRRLARHAKNCANYNDKKCIDNLCGLCIVAIDSDRIEANTCPFFVKYVLPSDELLAHEYAKYFEQKDKPCGTVAQCVRCGDDYIKKSNRAKYCEHCRRVRKRQQTIDSNNRRRKSGR